MKIKVNSFYTAIGRYECSSHRHACPVIIIDGKEFMLDRQEMLIWSILNWRILRKQEIGALYEIMVKNIDPLTERSFDACLDRLVIRGLLATGTGETDYDALYDLISPLYIVPTDAGLLRRIISVLKLHFIDNYPFIAARKIMIKDHRSDSEKIVMNLAHQALLSTAEIIKCADNNIHYLPDENSLMEQLYSDPITSSDNICSLMKLSQYAKEIILVVTALYLREQIIFERI